jgi:DNA-binding MarR family transcriptional regulator
MKSTSLMAPNIELAYIEELLVRLTVLRRQPAYRQLLAEGTGIEGRITTMRLIRAVHDLTAAGACPSVREVAERIGIEQSNASRAVDYATERGLIVKGQSGSDGRRLELALTDRGRAVILELISRRNKVHTDMLQSWTNDEVATLSRLLEKLCAAYENLTAANGALEQLMESPQSGHGVELGTSGGAK